MEQVISDDATWWYHPGPVTSADIYQGEQFDARLAVPGWDEPGPSAQPQENWTVALPQQPPSAHVKLTSHAVLPTIQVDREYSPCQFWESSPGVFVYDFCQNMAGFASLTVPEGVAVEAGTAIHMLYAEAIRGFVTPLFRTARS